MPHRTDHTHPPPAPPPPSFHHPLGVMRGGHPLHVPHPHAMMHQPHHGDTWGRGYHPHDPQSPQVRIPAYHRIVPDSPRRMTDVHESVGYRQSPFTTAPASAPSALSTNSADDSVSPARANKRPLSEPGQVETRPQKSNYESPEEAAASALLFAANAMAKNQSKPYNNRGEHQATSATTEEEKKTEPAPGFVSKVISGKDPETIAESATDASNEPIPRSVSSSERGPAKKRKKHRDFLRRHNRVESHDQEKLSSPKSHPCQVSPISNNSMETAADGHVESAASAAPTSANDTADVASETTKEHVPTPKTTISKPQLPPRDVVVPHFPSVLHYVLSNSEYSNSVLMWLPHGQAWRIGRWDALQREVLPKLFPQLCDGDDETKGGTTGSIDSFLWHVRAWGFQEIKDGPDVGAYQHMLFLRGLPNLCMQMRLSAEHSPRADACSQNKTVPPDGHQTSDTGRLRGPHALLQVPALTPQNEGVGYEDGASDTQRQIWAENRRRAVDDEERFAAAHRTHYAMMEGTMGENQSWNPRRISLGQHSVHMMNYHGMDTRQQSHESPRIYPMRGKGMPQDQDFVMVRNSLDRHRSMSGVSMAYGGGSSGSQYDSQRGGVNRTGDVSPRLQSGRGGTRASAIHKRVDSERSEDFPSDTSTSSFPVSQRGKGVHPRAMRASSRESPCPYKLANSPMFGANLQKSPTQRPPSINGMPVAVAVSKKTKRQPPPQKQH